MLTRPATLLLLTVLSAMPAVAQSAPGTLSTRLEVLVPQLMADGDVPGVSIALVEDGRVTWARGFGVANVQTGMPVDTSMVFEAASLSKPVFARVVLTLVERGWLDLDTPLSRYLPEPYVRDDERIHRITARSVLSHTTGFPNWSRSEPLGIRFDPGTRFSYSGEGFVYLQRVVEHVTGETLDALAREIVFTPVAMPSSGYVWRDEYDRSKAYGHDANGQLRERNRQTRANAAASLEATAPDYARFVAATLRGDDLAPQLYRAMLSPVSRADARCAVCVDREAGPTSDVVAWGLGWGLHVAPGDTAFWHWGDNGDMKAFVMASPETGRGLVLMTNGANGLRIAREIVLEVFGQAAPVFDWLDYTPYVPRR